jgi:F-type H+-transporting ATPase subunit b
MASPMELLKHFCVDGSRGRHFRHWGILLVVLITFPIAAFPQQSSTSSPAETDQAGHHKESPLAIVWKWGNFLILFGGLGWYLRKPLREFLDTRSKAIEEGLSSGRRAKEEALRKLAEIEARLAHLDLEIKSLKDHARAEAEEEKAKILAGSREEAGKILEMASREIEGLKRSARLELQSHVAELAVKLAEERLKHTLTPEQNGKMIQQFLQTLDATKN